MFKKTVDDYIEQGIYGKKEINPDERRKFLGTLRERIVIALSNAQVRGNRIFPVVEEEVKNNKDAVMYLNGHIDYSYLSKYVQMALKYKVPYTIVNNKEYNSQIGMVLAYDYAIDREEIYIQENNLQVQNVSQEKEPKKKISFWKKLWK